MTFERTHDAALIASIVTHPKLYRGAILADYAPAPDSWRAPASAWCVIPRDSGSGAPLGVFCFVPRTPVWWDVHLCLLPAAWGRAREISSECALWLRDNSTCRKLTAAVPTYNRLAHALAVRMGLERVGVLSASIPHGGRLYDQTIFALSI